MNDRCKIPKCERIKKARGMCFAHYQRKRRNSKTPLNEMVINAKSGHTKLPEYKVWQSMKRRCSPHVATEYPRYSGRGIAVCKRWLARGVGFSNFYNDMGARPSSKHQLDRIDNNGDYTPENCRWVVASVNSANRDSVYAKSGFHGVDFFANKWRAAIVINQQKLYIGLFSSIEEAAWWYDQYSLALRDPTARLNFDYI